MEKLVVCNPRCNRDGYRLWRILCEKEKRGKRKSKINLITAEKIPIYKLEKD